MHASEYIFFREASRISRKVCAILCKGDNIFTHFSNALLITCISNVIMSENHHKTMSILSLKALGYTQICLD